MCIRDRKRDYVTDRVRTLTFEVYVCDDQTYEFLRTLECGTILPCFYYETLGKCLFGDQVDNTDLTGIGIQAESIKVSFVYEQGRESVEKAIITLTWSSLISPRRITNPLA